VVRLHQRCHATLSARTIRRDLIGPVWEPKFAAALAERGLPIEQQYPAEGYYLDIAIFQPGLKLNIEVDGEAYHRDELTGDRTVDDVYRDTLLKAAGWFIQRFWVYELKEDFDGCVQRVCDIFERSGKGLGQAS